MGLNEDQVAGFRRPRVHGFNRSPPGALREACIVWRSRYGTLLGIFPFYSAASASACPANSPAYLVIPTIVKTLVKCAESPNA